MSDEKKFDEETQKFYDENKEMIDKILAQTKEESSGSERAHLEEMLRREAFERKARMEFEAEKARREAFDKAERAYEDFRYGRDRSEKAFEESRDHFREYSHRQGDYALSMIFDELDRMRDGAFRGRQYMHDRYASDRDIFKESRDRCRQTFNDGFDDLFGPLSDAQFQKHLFGAGLELWMAFHALVKSAPLPESVKDAFTSADSNKNFEFCTKNPKCGKKGATESEEQVPSSGHLQPISIKKKEE